MVLPFGKDNKAAQAVVFGDKTGHTQGLRNNRPSPAHIVDAVASSTLDEMEKIAIRARCYAAWAVDNEAPGRHFTPPSGVNAGQ